MFNSQDKTAKHGTNKKRKKEIERKNEREREREAITF